MPKFQLLTGFVNLGGSRDNVAFRGEDNPMTLAESIVLAAIHGGPEHVHSLVSIGEDERSHADELARLSQKYGKVAAELFPVLAGQPALPERDDNLPTPEEVAAGEEAKKAAIAKARTKKAPASTSAPAAASTAAVPSLADLPK